MKTRKNDNELCDFTTGRSSQSSFSIRFFTAANRLRRGFWRGQIAQQQNLHMNNIELS